MGIAFIIHVFIWVFGHYYKPEPEIISFSTWFIESKYKSFILLGLKASITNFKSSFFFNLSKLSLTFLYKDSDTDIKVNKDRKVQIGVLDSNIKSGKLISKKKSIVY